MGMGAAMLAVPAWAQGHSVHRGHGGHGQHTRGGPLIPAGFDEVSGDIINLSVGSGHRIVEARRGPGIAVNGSVPGPLIRLREGQNVRLNVTNKAGSGPPRAADAIWGADAMVASRRDLQQTRGDFPLFWFQADRAEVQRRDGAEGYLWDVQGYYGGPTSRLWFKSEGEGSFGEAIDDAEVQALYSRAIAPFFDVQAGVRQDLTGPVTTHAIVGIQGVAPYMFEIDAALFLSHRGDATARIEAELDQRITQSLILQPRIEVNLSAQDIRRLGIGAGLDSIELEVRLRYEIRREFAPYVGVEQSWRIGQSADFARAAGEDTGTTNFVVGVRFWF
jgi:copper resistance protein B